MLPHSGLNLPLFVSLIKTVFHRYTQTQLRWSNTSLRLSSKVILLEPSRQLNLVIDVLNSGDFTSLMNININMNIFSPVNLPSVSLICRFLNSISRRIEKKNLLQCYEAGDNSNWLWDRWDKCIQEPSKCIYYFFKNKRLSRMIFMSYNNLISAFMWPDAN